MIDNHDFILINSDYDNGIDDNRISATGMPKMPTTQIGLTSNAPAPLGSGLLIMTALGAGYAVARRKKLQSYY